MRLSKNDKLIIIYLVALFILAVCTVVILIVCPEDEPTYEVSQQYIRPGDTLDGIATKYCSKKEDRRDYYYRVLELNGRTDDKVYAGETIKIYKEIER